MKTKMKKFMSGIFGIAIGLINGTIGAGGGLVAVPLLQKSGLAQKDSHANALAVLLPISLVSALTYIYRGQVKITDALPFMPTSVLGAVLGTVALRKIPTNLLSKIFAVFMLYVGVRLLLK